MENKQLYATDDVLREIADLLFDGGGDEIVAKMNPDGADLAADKRKRKITAGLSAVGATAGAAGLALGAKNLRGAYKIERAGQKTANMFHAPGAKKKAFKAAAGKEKFATGLIPLEVAGLTGEVAATHILHGDTKKKPIQKDLIPTRGQKVQLAANTGIKAGKGSLKGVQYVNKNKGKLAALPNKVTTRVRKSEYDVRWEGEFSKVNTDKQQVFGWASIVELDGQPVVDLQGDYISIDEVEKSAYEYVHKSRKGGDMHLRDGEQPVVASNMIESFVVTPEKKEALGLPESAPTGWWVGFQVNDPDLWSKVKSGQRTGFSIHGRGVRSAV
jgi:hypothetical protein